MVALRPRAREGASAAFQPPTASARRGTVWVFGGCGGEDGETLFDDVWAFDVDAEAWTMRQGESVAVTSGGARLRGARAATAAVGFATAAFFLANAS